MRTETPFVETEALLIALANGESDELLAYLEENFYPNELVALSRACRALSWSAHDVASRMRRRSPSGKERP